MNTSPAQVWRIESGEYNPTLKTIGKLGEALGIELGSLLCGESPTRQESTVEASNPDGNDVPFRVS